MNIQRIMLSAVLAASLGVLVSPSVPGVAVQLSDGKTHFVQPPRLLGASTSQSGAYVWGARYYFTLTLPENAGEPLQQVVISQSEGIEFPYFDVSDTQVFEGTRDRERAKLPLKQVVVDRKARTVTITFDPPVAPGRTVTIELYPVRNPLGGIYLYGVTAFPAGEQSAGQFLGYGRIHIHDSHFRRFHRRWW
jgi:hypothetical protein